MTHQATIAISGGGESVTLTEDQFHRAAREMAEADRDRRRAPPVKNTPEDLAVSDQAYSVAADELRQFIEQQEQLDAEARDIAERKKEGFAEAKARGYCTKVMRKIIAERKRDRDDLAEEAAILDLYRSALEMG